MLKYNYSLSNYNTFRFNISTKYFFSFTNEKELIDFINEKNDLINNGFFILGGGSNVLFAKDFQGLIFHSQINFIKIHSEDKLFINYEVGSGVIWDDFVNFCVQKKLYGIENLSYVPGNVGAVPVQNIGAYGAEAKDVIVEVKGFDIITRKFISLKNEECRFGYRNSIFKTEQFKNVIILSVVFKLSKYSKKKVILKQKYSSVNSLFFSFFYIADIFKTLFKLNKFLKLKPSFSFNTDYLKSIIADYGLISLSSVRKSIISIRKRRIPDYNVYGNAGSFYKSPIVTKAQLLDMKKNFDDIIYFQISDDAFKVSVGWLIDKIGYRGKKMNNIGIDPKKTNMILNFGNGQGKDIIIFAQEIENLIYKMFGIIIEKEVVVVD